MKSLTFIQISWLNPPLDSESSLVAIACNIAKRIWDKREWLAITQQQLMLLYHHYFLRTTLDNL